MAIQIGSSAIAAMMLGTSVVDAVYLGAVNIWAGGGGGDWILALGAWNDAGVWDDASNWMDAP